MVNKIGKNTNVNVKKHFNIIFMLASGLGIPYLKQQPKIAWTQGSSSFRTEPLQALSSDVMANA